jgi:hypothetical protein
MRQRLITSVAAAGGLMLFAIAVRQAGIGEIAGGIRRIGWGLVPVIALGGVRFVLRAECWRLCMPPDARMPFGRAFAAFLAGDAVGNVTPLGMAASEPAKFFLTRQHLASREALASLAVDNLVYAASVATVLIAGSLVVLARLRIPLGWQEAAAAVLAAAGVGLVLGARLLRGTWRAEDGERPRWRARLASVRESALRFSAGHPGRLGGVFLLHMAYHALAVTESYLTLAWLLDAGPTITQAIAFEVALRVTTIVFKFVPFRVGVDEALAGALAPVLALQLAAGVSLAVVRKVRNLFWTGVGLLLISVSRAPAAPATDRRETAAARRT